MQVEETYAMRTRRQADIAYQAGIAAFVLLALGSLFVF